MSAQAPYRRAVLEFSVHAGAVLGESIGVLEDAGYEVCGTLATRNGVLRLIITETPLTQLRLPEICAETYDTVVIPSFFHEQYGRQSITRLHSFHVAI
jgi:hypothetical protein